jgi:uncharacterized protein with FMN-binding domain
MKRIVLWFMSTLTVVTLLFGYHTSTSSQMAGGTTSVLAALHGTTSGTTSGTASGTTTGGGAAATAPLTVTGDSTDTRWGPVQVRITVDGSTITDVTVVDYPHENGRDQQINARALPVLVQETLDAQSANIDMVSGATVTSEGYLGSLQSALDQAGL